MYKKEIDPRFGLYLKSKGEGFGVHKDYVAREYPYKEKNIQVYGTSTTEPLQNRVKVTRSEDLNSGIETNNNVEFDAAGHRGLFGIDKKGNEYTME